MSFLFGKRQTITNTENKLGAVRIQSSAQGLPIPIVFGQTRITSNLIDYFDFTAIPNTETTTTGGKGGGGVTSSSTTYTYTVGVLLALCEGPVPGSSFLGTIWSGKALTDATTLGLTEFNGSYSQGPFSYLTSAHPERALNYRGTALVAASALNLGNSDSLPNLSFEVTGLMGPTDVNPANVVTTLLTDANFGAGWTAGQVSVDDFWHYCDQANIRCSPAYTTQRPATELVTELAKLGNAAPVWSDGVLRLVPYADTAVGTYTPDLTVQYALTDSDFIAGPGEDPVRFRRKRQADAKNQVQLEIWDRANAYNPAIVEAKDQADIDLYGLRPLEPIEAHAICDMNVGRSVAQAILQRTLYVRNTYEFTVGWRYARLEPMDIVTLTEARMGLSALMVRITSIEEDADGQLLMTAEEIDVGVSTPGAYSAQAAGGASVNTDVNPGNAATPVILQPPLALTGGTPQVWIGTSGGADWGGAQVWVSIDGGASYARAGVILADARHGVLSANLPSAADPDTTSTMSIDLSASGGTLVSAANTAADAGETLSWVGQPGAEGELVAYSTVTLTAPSAYDADGYIRRAQRGSTVAAHVAGASFLRLDDAVARVSVSPALFGTTLHIKLLSYNTTGGGLQSLADVAAHTYTLRTQVTAAGGGYAYIADTTSTTVADPGNGRVRWDNATQSNATKLILDALTADGASMSAYLTAAGNTGFLDLRSAADAGKWATYQVTAGNAQAGYHVFDVTYQAGGAPMPDGETVMLTLSPSLPSGVTSVGLSLPASIFTVSNSPVTTTGTLTASLIAQNAAQVLAGPLTGNAAAPTFRALATTDIPAGANGQQLVTANGVVTWANAPWAVTLSYASTPTANQVLVRFRADRALTFPAAFAGSTVCDADVVATANTVLTVKRDTTAIGTITYTAGANTPTLATTGNAAQSVAAGEIFSIVGPTSADATLSGAYALLVASRG